ncbi:18S rRNA biogenesis protein RCL1 [Fonticula alba]|uniref:18S rRNA biogenesis protein RCL1 n=1 Tax=Fonticula alba TaxID=691883 RepID=A0A058ZCY2_FONAL|nr:18S rRNA biogenesis protein RCL1 [Fonticula alba]KCV72270.1 18S rRNA biogenesis protein RCL1 [Fonticula alba]|eukprot:XP_009493848.1 18S rRNA biogenesis protein RCL1 [Fonticula alba]
MSSTVSSLPPLEFEGCNYFRQRIILSLLSGRAIRIINIRTDEADPGLVDYEVAFLKLIDRVTNGTNATIGYTGSSVTFRPGALIGGKLEFDCGVSRGIGYFLEPIITLAPFCKKPTVITLTGITNSDNDLCVDTIRTVMLPTLIRFGIEDGLEMKINRRGAPPLGGGEVFFRCLPVKALKAVDFSDAGRIKRIRGIAYSARMSPAHASRSIEAARSLLNKFIPDVYIYADHYSGRKAKKTAATTALGEIAAAEAGLSPGYGISLVAESTTGALLSAESCGAAGEPPEELGLRVARLLYSAIDKGGICDALFQNLHLLLVTLSPEDVSRLRFGKLTPYTIQYLQDLKEFFGIVFKLKADNESRTVLLSAMGIGFTNVHRKID